jgi:hypothetical protein
MTKPRNAHELKEASMNKRTRTRSDAEMKRSKNKNQPKITMHKTFYNTNYKFFFIVSNFRGKNLFII